MIIKSFILLLVFTLFSQISIYAASASWIFTTSGNYTPSDATKVVIADGVARLIAIDQTDNDNTALGFGAGTHNLTQWDAGNSWVELQAAQTSGDLTSRVLDAGRAATWDSISWIPQRSVYKELPGSATTESGYTTGNIDMTGNVLLYHLNESSGAIVDASGQGNTGSVTGATYGVTGKYNTALSFNFTDYIDCGTDPSLRLTTGGTIEAWIYPISDGGSNYGRIVDKSISSVSGDDGYEFDIEDTDNLGLNIDGQVFDLHTTGGVVNLSAWNHVAVTFDGSYWKIYSNGTEVASRSSSVLPPNVSANVRIGNLADDTYEGFDGTIDEVAIYSRALSPTEIADRYKRGALKIRHQVRSGSSNPPSGSFIGPDGTTGTYYSELSNSTTGLPVLDLTNVSDNRYFQYKTFFDTDNTTYTPELTSITIGPTHYPEDNPTVVNNTGQSFTDLTSFSETLGVGNDGTVQYQISNNGTNWYYWNSSNWVAATGYAQSNMVADVNTNIGQFVTDIGTGNFYFRSFLHSTLAVDQVELDQVDLGYTPAVLSVSIGDPTFTFGTNQLDIWLPPQTSVITNDGTVAETFVAQISQYTDGGNNWAISNVANGADQIRAQWSITSDTGPWTDITAYDSDFTIATNVASSGTVTLWLRIQTPTSTTSYTEYSSTLTVTAQAF